MNYQEKYEQWLKSPLVDDELMSQLREIKDNEEQKMLRFSQNLSFGTAGMRGVLGAGSNNMNIVTVGWITQGLANMLLSRRLASRGVVIGRDSRLFSKEFAYITARIFAANGIKVYFFENICPTPQVSYAVRRLNAAMGVNITASHNPKEYNGYKVYASDGAQISPAQANEIVRFAGENVLCHRSICEYSKAVDLGMIEVISNSINIDFLNEVNNSIGDIYPYNKNLKVVYTSLHGSGHILVPKLLKDRGFNVYTVEEQMEPNGNFPTCNPPNPEREEAYELAVKMAKKVNADIVLATDPDTDRVGVCVLHKGEYVFLTGNRIGALLCRYRLENSGSKNKTPLVVKSLVSTDMVAPICQKHGAILVNVPTGFKYIGEQMAKYEDNEKVKFILGFEESYGYLGGGYARDKDAVFAAGCIAQLSAFCKSKNISCIDYLNEMFKEYGYYCEKTEGVELNRVNGMELLNERLKAIRANGLNNINGIAVNKTVDYLEGVGDIPPLNILEFVLEKGSKVIIRPSGTEPKVKIYALCKGESSEQANALCNALCKAARSLVVNETA